MRSLFKSRKIISVCMVIVLMFLLVPATYAASESESNNTYSTADITTDDANNTGTISSLNDVDWWKVTFNQDGWANYWLGELKGVNDFDLALYDSNGTTLLEESKNSSNVHELIRYKVKKDITYYIKISAYVVDSSVAKTYKFCAKVYDIDPSYIFTYNYIENGAPRNNVLPDSTIKLLWNMGYTYTQYVNNSANTVYNSLPNSKLFLFHNHGATGGGAVQAYAGSTGQYDWIYAKNGPYNNINQSPSLANAKLVIWMGCYTANTSPTYGNLVDETLNKGAGCSIGWYYETYSSPIGNDWLKGFFEAAGEGELLKDCLVAANEYIKPEYYDNMDDITAYTNMIDWYVGNSNVHQVIG